MSTGPVKVEFSYGFPVDIDEVEFSDELARELPDTCIVCAAPHSEKTQLLGFVRPPPAESLFLAVCTDCLECRQADVIAECCRRLAGHLIPPADSERAVAWKSEDIERWIASRHSSGEAA